MVTLIVLNYNDYETTQKFVLSIKKYTCFEHIVIVDNCSTDDSYTQLKKIEKDHIVLIQTEKNRGYASGNNFGIQYAIKNYAPSYVIVSNPDVKFSEKMVEQLVENASKLERLGAITCIMKCTSNIHLPVAWHIPTYKDCLMENLLILKRLLHYDIEYPADYYDSPIVQVDAIPGSFVLLDVKAFKEVGGFDEGTFLYYEENILGYRFKERGFKSYLLTTQTYIHAHSVSINKNISSVARRLWLSYNSRRYYCKKYLGIGKIKEFLLNVTFAIGLIDYQLTYSVRRLCQ